MRWLSFLFLPVVGAVIKGISYFGLETNLRNLDCSWEHDTEFYIKSIRDIGFNSLRIPFSAQYIHEGNFDRLDELFRLSNKYDIDILLDYHRTYSSHQGDFHETNLNDFIDTWKAVLIRYENQPKLKAVGLYNEFQGTDFRFWNDIMRKAIQGIESEFPDRFQYFVGCPRWGGDCSLMDLSDLPYWNDRIRIEIHKYIFSSGAHMKQDLDYSFGQYPHKIVVGEWGYMSDKPEEVAWANNFVDYLIDRNIRDSFFWVLVFNSGDTGGIFKDCNNLDWDKVNLLKKLWGDV